MTRITDGGFLIDKIHHLGRRVFGKLLREREIVINPGQGRILYALWKEDGVSIKELAKKTALGKSTLTDMLDRLEESGHLTREMSETDRREVIIKLTEKTKELNQEYISVSLKMKEIFYANFSETEIEEFEEFLTRVQHNLLRAEKDG